jgi:hypothetical protein
MSTTRGEFKTKYAIEMPDGSLFKSPYSGAEVTWTDRPRAEEILEQLRMQATYMGVTDYRGRIVRQLCTPFIGDDDNADHLIAELNKWLADQTGGTQ